PYRITRRAGRGPRERDRAGKTRRAERGAHQFRGDASAAAHRGGRACNGSAARVDDVVDCPGRSRGERAAPRFPGKAGGKGLARELSRLAGCGKRTRASESAAGWTLTISSRHLPSLCPAPRPAGLFLQPRVHSKREVIANMRVSAVIHANVDRLSSYTRA